MIGLEHYMVLAMLVFALAVLGLMFNRRQLLGLLMCMECMLLAVNTLLVAFSWSLGDVNGHIWVFMCLAVSAAEVALGLAMAVLMWRRYNTIDMCVIDERIQ